MLIVLYLLMPNSKLLSVLITNVLIKQGPTNAVGIYHEWYVILAKQRSPKSAAKTEPVVLAVDQEGTVWPESHTTNDQFPFYHLPKKNKFIKKSNKSYQNRILKCCCQIWRVLSANGNCHHKIQIRKITHD